MKPHLLFFVFVVLGSDPKLSAQGDSVFEARHAHAEAKNPHGLAMVLDTVDGRRTYSESEYIPLLIRYSSAIRDKYKIEVAFGNNGAATSQLLYADVQTPAGYSGAVICCRQLLKPMNSAPQVVKPYIIFRLKPGKHEVYRQAGFPMYHSGRKGKGPLNHVDHSVARHHP